MKPFVYTFNVNSVFALRQFNTFMSSINKTVKFNKIEFILKGSSVIPFFHMSVIGWIWIAKGQRKECYYFTV